MSEQAETTLYVVAVGATNQAAEQEYGKMLKGQLNAAPGKWPARIVTESTGQGAVRLTIQSSDWGAVNRTKSGVIRYLRSLGEQVGTDVGQLMVTASAAVGNARGAPLPRLSPAEPLVAPRQSAPTERLAITDDILYLMFLAKRPRTPEKLATILGCPKDLIDIALAQMANTGLVAYETGTIFWLTEDGRKKAANTEHRGGRKGTMEALLAAPDHQLTAADIAEQRQCSVAVVRISLSYLIRDGLVESTGTEIGRPRKGGRPRALYRLTALGKTVGHDYTPKTRRGKDATTNPWGRMSDQKLKVIQALLERRGCCTAPELVRDTGVAYRSTRSVLEAGCQKGLVVRSDGQNPNDSPTYLVTPEGNAAGRDYVQAAKLALTPNMAPHSVTYMVTIDTQVAAAEMYTLLESLGGRPGVKVEPWPT